MYEKRELWLQLCEQAAIEQDPIKFLALITEINKLLIAKEERLARLRSGEKPTD